MTKLKIAFYTIADFEEEELWLRKMHNEGLKLVKMIPPCFYYFEECDPEDVIYRLDFKNDSQESTYLQMFEDFGWEYAGKCVGWVYFRKPASEVESEEDSEIFSDCASRVSMIEKIIKTRMLPILCIFCCCVIPQLLSTHSYHGDIFFKVFFSLMAVLYIYLITHCGFKLQKLKKELK